MRSAIISLTQSRSDEATLGRARIDPGDERRVEEWRHDPGRSPSLRERLENDAVARHMDVAAGRTTTTAFDRISRRRKNMDEWFDGYYPKAAGKR